jgi:LysR family transcriptional regulator for bpeEF and oprC
LGIAQIPAFVLKDALERGALELVLADWVPEPIPLHVVYPENRHLSSKIRVFVDWIGELFAEHDGIQLRSTLRALAARIHAGRSRIGSLCCCAKPHRRFG